MVGDSDVRFADAQRLEAALRDDIADAGGSEVVARKVWPGRVNGSTYLNNATSATNDRKKIGLLEDLVPLLKVLANPVTGRSRTVDLLAELAGIGKGPVIPVVGVCNDAPPGLGGHCLTGFLEEGAGIKPGPACDDIKRGP